MKSVSGKNWEEIFTNPRLIEKAKLDYNLNDLQSKLVISRKFTDIELYTIRNKLNLTNPFYKNLDFISACELLKKHLDKKNDILVIGDYDVDGCISTSLMVNFLKKFKIKVTYYIPDRFKDGYGANKDLVKKLIFGKKINLVMFLDCGSSSHGAIDYLKKENIDTIIIDHHNLHKPHPLSNILINPKKNIDFKKYDYLCSAFLTYLFIDLYYNINKIKSSLSKNLIYVLLATISDIMPIRGLNRLLAINVLRNFDINKNIIINTIFKLSNLKKKIEIDDLGYLIGPIINSAGRISNANQIIKLLTSSSIKDKNRIIENIVSLNKKRKNLEKRILDNINYKDIEKTKGIIFIYLPNVSEGIIGIIASRIKEYFNKPCVVLTNSSDILKGSARSTSNFNIGDYIYKALNKNILINGGGHNLAAGVSLSKNRLNDFKYFLNSFFVNNNFLLNNNYISRIPLSSINKKLINDINLIGPFGFKNSKPIFLVKNILLIKPQILKNKYISCFVKSNNKIIRAISFNQITSRVSYEILNSKTKVNIFVKLAENVFNNSRNIQVEIIDINKATINT